MVYAATEHDQVYAFDVKTGTSCFGRRNFWISNSPSRLILPVAWYDVGNNGTGCNGTGNEIGITSTPRHRPPTNEMYVVAATKEIVNNTKTLYQRMHVLDISTGAEKLSGPYFWRRPITAKTPGTGEGSSGDTLCLIPGWRISARRLLLANGLIFVSWEHTDRWLFHGYFMAFNKNTLQPSGVFVSTPNASNGGIWKVVRAQR